MTKYLIKWQKNESLMPEDPAMMAKLQLSLLEVARANLKSGKMIDWGSYCDASGGYCKPVLSVDQVIGAIDKAMIESKPK